MIVVAAAETGGHGPSEDTGVFSANEAVARGLEYPEVGAWVTAVKGQSPQNRAVIEVNSEDAAVYIVHAYEIVDDGAVNHTPRPSAGTRSTRRPVVSFGLCRDAGGQGWPGGIACYATDGEP